MPAFDISEVRTLSIMKVHSLLDRRGMLQIAATDNSGYIYCIVIE